MTRTTKINWRILNNCNSELPPIVKYLSKLGGKKTKKNYPQQPATSSLTVGNVMP